MGKAWAGGLKSLVYCKQSGKYYCQPHSRLCGKHAQWLLPRTDREEPLFRAWLFGGNMAVQARIWCCYVIFTIFIRKLVFLTSNHIIYRYYLLNLLQFSCSENVIKDFYLFVRMRKRKDIFGERLCECERKRERWINQFIERETDK